MCTVDLDVPSQMVARDNPTVNPDQDTRLGNKSDHPAVDKLKLSEALLVQNRK